MLTRRGFLQESLGVEFYLNELQLILLTRSTEFNHADWNATGFTITTNYNAELVRRLKHLTNTAQECGITAASGSFTQDTAINIGTENAVFSVYLRTHEAGTKSGTLYNKARRY